MEEKEDGDKAARMFIGGVVGGIEAKKGMAEGV